MQLRLINRLKADLKQTQQTLATKTDQNVQLQEKANKLYTIATAIHSVQESALPSVVGTTDYNSKMESLKAQLDTIEINPTQFPN